MKQVATREEAVMHALMATRKMEHWAIILDQGIAGESETEKRQRINSFKRGHNREILKCKVRRRAAVMGRYASGYMT